VRIHQAQLAAHGLGEADNGVLGRRVRGPSGGAELAGLRGDVDDMAAFARDHARECELHAEDDAVQVDVDHALRGQVVLVEEAADLHDACVVDEHVQRPELALGLVEKCGEGIAVGHVQRQRDGAGAEFVGGLARGVEVDVADRHLHSLTEQRLRGRASDAAGCAGDRGCLSGEDARLLGHSLPPDRAGWGCRRSGWHTS
jgi:hypothetical protein